jgi:hypothetical protein
MASKFSIGDKVDQASNNHAEGTVVAIFTDRAGECRYAVEMFGHRTIQIASETSLMLTLISPSSLRPQKQRPVAVQPRKRPLSLLERVHVVRHLTRTGSQRCFREAGSSTKCGPEIRFRGDACGSAR